MPGSTIDVGGPQETPDVPAVQEIQKPAPRTVLRGQNARIAAVVGVIGAAALSALYRDQKPKSPRPPSVIHGAPGGGGAPAEECEVDPGSIYPDPRHVFGVDGVHVVEGVDAFACDFEVGEDGEEGVIGTEYVDGAQVRQCFFSRVWTPGAALRLAGHVRGNLNKPGEMRLTDGILDVSVGVDSSDPEADETEKKILVDGEASLAVTTTGRASVTKMPPPEGRGESEEVLVAAIEGQTLIYQEGRDEAIILNECDKIRIPLNIAEANGGCYIAHNGGGRGSSSNGSEVMLLAGGVLLALRRKRRKKTQKA